MGSWLQKITRLAGKAIGDFDLIREGDRVCVALSGGKDSWSLLLALDALRKKAPVKFSLHAVTIDPGFECRAMEALGQRLRDEGLAHQVIPSNMVEIINEYLTPGTNPCSFCARLRRGMLYTHAIREGCHKIALGHHLDDCIETLLLNLFFNGSIKGMSPLLRADDGHNTIIRPLVYVRESLTRECARETDAPILGCACAYQGMSAGNRVRVKELITQLEREFPNVRSNMLASMGRVYPRHLFPNALKSDQSDEAAERNVPRDS